MNLVIMIYIMKILADDNIKHIIVEPKKEKINIKQ